MLRICEVDNVDAFYYTDDSEIILTLQQRGVRPYCRDMEGVFYFKKNNKLFKVLDKLNIEY